MRRHFSEEDPEWMDLPSPDETLIRDDLTNLEYMNRIFGGRSQVVAAVKELAGSRRELSVFDLATGFSDHPRALHEWARKENRKLKIIAADFQRRTLELASEATPDGSAIAFVQADIRHLPFKDAAADIALNALALHHFSNEDAVTVLREQRRVSRACATLDLIRSYLAFAAIWVLLTFLIRSPMTRHDGMVSIKRAFTGEEISTLAKEAGWGNFRYRALPYFRQAIFWHQPSV